MILPICTECTFGGIKDEQSFCERESVYSKHSRCILNKALDYYIEQTAVPPAAAKQAINR